MKFYNAQTKISKETQDLKGRNSSLFHLKADQVV